MSLTVATISRKPLYGKRLVLELVNSDYVDFLVKCYQLDEFMDCYRLAQTRDIDVEKMRKHLDHKNQSIQHPKNLEWVIKRASGGKGEGELIGLASLADYNSHHNRAEFLVGIIDPKDQAKGLALEASLLVFEFAFQQVKLHKLICIIYAFNKKAQENALHLGFTQEAFFCEHYLNPRNSTFIDLYQNGLLKNNFFASKNISRWSMRLLGRDITKVLDNTLKQELMTVSQLAKSKALLLGFARQD